MLPLLPRDDHPFFPIAILLGSRLPEHIVPSQTVPGAEGSWSHRRAQCVGTHSVRLGIAGLDRFDSKFSCPESCLSKHSGAPQPHTDLNGADNRLRPFPTHLLKAEKVRLRSWHERVPRIRPRRVDFGRRGYCVAVPETRSMGYLKRGCFAAPRLPKNAFPFAFYSLCTPSDFPNFKLAEVSVLADRYELRIQANRSHTV